MIRLSMMGPMSGWVGSSFPPPALLASSTLSFSRSLGVTNSDFIFLTKFRKVKQTGIYEVHLVYPSFPNSWSYLGLNQLLLSKLQVLQFHHQPLKNLLHHSFQAWLKIKSNAKSATFLFLILPILSTASLTLFS